MQLHDVLILFDNIHDCFPVATVTDADEPRTLQDVLKQIATRLRFKLELCDCGFEAGGSSEAGRSTGTRPRRPDLFGALDKADPQERICLVFSNVVALFPEVTYWRRDDWELHATLLAQLNQGRGRHRFIFIFPDAARIPVNFLAGVPGVVQYAIPLPDGQEREVWAEQRLKSHFSDALTGTLNHKELRRFTALAEGLHWQDLTRLATEADQKKRPLAELVRLFKFGEAKDYWRELLSSRRAELNGAFAEFTNGREPLLGQDEAVHKALNVVAKACYNLSELVAPAYNRPRGVLFFVGPTGVGKTMLAKKLAGLIFDDEASCIVFDMSEYSQPHMEARLLGAPPGYVGYDAGGQLTGLVAKRPFSVVLFDEIDKTHPAILTKFLQILDEGRLTDGRGQTCFFSETLIIFTSNAGARELQVGPATEDRSGQPHRDSPYENLQRYYENRLKDAPGLREHPEILNRIGLANIIPFRHIGDVELVRRVIGELLDRTITYFTDPERDIDIDIPDREQLLQHLLMHSQWQEFGMRNVKQAFEAEVLEPMATALLANPERRPLSIQVGSTGVTVTIRRNTA